MFNFIVIALLCLLIAWLLCVVIWIIPYKLTSIAMLLFLIHQDLEKNDDV